MILGVASGVFWFLFFLLIHICWFHYVYVRDSFKLIMKLLVGCTAGHCSGVLLITWFFASDFTPILSSLYGVLIIFSLFIVYMPFYYTIATSLSVQTLIALEGSPDKRLSMDELRSRFASHDTVSKRLLIMVNNGYLDADAAGRYHTTLKGHRVSQCFGYLKELWRLGPGG